MSQDIGQNVQTVVLDTTSEAAVSAFFSIAATFDHVVISAAQTPGGPVRKLPLDDAYAAMDSKFWGAYRVARHASIKAGGSLTFVSGFLSVRPTDLSFRIKPPGLGGEPCLPLESIAEGAFGCVPQRLSNRADLLVLFT